MGFWTAYAFIALSSVIDTALASDSSGAHHASITDLIPSFINVGILFGVLIWKIKGPLKTHYNTKSEDVANTLERANLKSKEAQLMLESQQRKMTALPNELKNIQAQSETDVVNYEKKLSKEMEDKSIKLKTDANSKIQADKKQLIDDLNAELLDQVISKTKSAIKGNKDHQSKVSSKLLQGL